MAFELPPNLHPNCGPVAWLLGRWHGNGHGDYPDVGPFQFGEEQLWQQDGRDFLHYMSRSWVVDENGAKVEDMHQETGFLRCPSPGEVELVLAHNAGFSEIWYGKAEAGKLELHTAGVAYTETAKAVTAGHRLYGNVDGKLLYAYDMEAMGHPMQPHIWATLERG